MTDTNQKVASLTQRVAYVKGELEAVPKNATNHHGKYKYASVDDVYHAVRPLMAEVEIDIKLDLVEKQVAENSKGTQYLHLTAKIWLESPGEKEEPQTRYLALPLTGPQTFEAAVSYLAKQFLRQRFCIETGEYDADDVAPATEKDPVPPPAPVKWTLDEATLELTCSGDPESQAAKRALFAELRAIMTSDKWTPETAKRARAIAEANHLLIGSLPPVGMELIKELWNAIPDGDEK